MLHPKYETRIGPTVFKPETSNEIVSIVVSASMDIPSDTFRGIFRNNGRAAIIKKEDPVNVSLGYEDSNSEVFQGKVGNIVLSTFELGVTGYSSILALCNLKKDKFYEQRTAGQIVKDLAAVGKVQIQDVEEGVRFPYYAIDSNKNAYEHIRALATICGFDIYCNEKDKLIFKKYNPITKHKADYGKNIIRISRADNLRIYEGVTVLGESPSSVSGAETSHWIKKEPMKSIAGNQDKSMYIINRAVKDEQTAKKIAESSLDALKFQMGIVLELIGDPKIKLGDGIVVSGVPSRQMNGEYQVRSVEHQLNKKEGFVTIVKCKGRSKN